jgi:hypothetical protein
MASLSDLHRAVEATLASKRIGHPVFVRYLFFDDLPTGEIFPRMSELVAAVHGWMRQAISKLHAIGSLQRGQISLMVQFEGGATALVTYASRKEGGRGVDLTILGNHGAIYHETTQLSIEATTLDETFIGAIAEALSADHQRESKP